MTKHIPLSENYLEKQGHDQCKNCIVRGDLQACERTVCNQHISWYPLELKRRHAALLDAVRWWVECKDLKRWIYNIRSPYFERGVGFVVPRDTRKHGWIDRNLEFEWEASIKAAESALRELAK